MDPAEDLLRRLALHDEGVLSSVLTHRVDADRRIELSPKVEPLVRLGAVLAIAIGYDVENGHEGPE